jgi:3-phenylpropionate/trans-cinnamate dioxygenase ferredoxin reductase component
VPERQVDVVLVGGGIASATAAWTLREEGFDGSVLLVGRELDPPYHRPPATKGYLVGRERRENALVHPPEWWERAGVELLTRTSVLALDPAARTAKLSSGEEVGFGQALLATGAMVRRLAVDGADLEGIHYVRVLANADALRRDVEGLDRVVCVGGSYIGSEVAASLTELGKRVTVLMQEEHVLERQFGARAGRFFSRVLDDHGIEVIGGDEVERFVGQESGRVRAVLTKGGRELPAEAVVCGVGAMPDVILARKSGLELGPLGGVRCDATLRTSAEAVFAAGDMCEYESVVHGRPMRIEHEEHAAAQGATAARNLLGACAPHEEVPYFFSDLSDWVGLEYVGPALSYDQEVVRGSMDDGAFSLWYLEDGRVRGMLSVARHGDLDRARALIRSGERVAADEL